MRAPDRHSIAVAIVVIAFFLATRATLAVEPPNFTGSYSEKSAKAKNKDSVPTTLNVVHDANAIQVTRTQGGRRTVSRFPLDGSEGDYTSPGGGPGKGKARLKGKNLILESIVSTRPDPNDSVVRIRTREKWELSPDGSVLTIRFNVEFPDASATIGNLLDQSWKETYLRTETK